MLRLEGFLGERQNPFARTSTGDKQSVMAENGVLNGSFGCEFRVAKTGPRGGEFHSGVKRSFFYGNSGELPLLSGGVGVCDEKDAGK